ncbi:hypothetical protein LTR17_009154 [Elasticomyces elasticus]|nr:hypothetical protein LTR17_009154 [Elasticomyces elasticus]
MSSLEWTRRSRVLTRASLIEPGSYRSLFWLGLCTSVSIVRASNLNPTTRLTRHRSNTRLKDTHISIASRPYSIDSLVHLGDIKTLRAELGAPLLDVARLTSSFEASNPHDKVYSLLGLILPEEALHIPPDYNAPPWTVDFTHMQRSDVYSSLRTDFQWRAEEPSYDPLVVLSTDLRYLTAKGLYFATIETTVPMFVRSNDWTYLTVADTVLLPAQIDRMIEQAKGRVAAVGRRTTLALLLRVNERQPEEDMFFALGRQLDLQASHRTEPQAIRDTLAMCFRHWKACISLRHPYAAEAPSWSDDEMLTDNFSMWERLMESAESICMFLTSNGFLGFAPGDTLGGDSVVFLRGARWPVVLRQHEDRWIFRGLVYVAGVMNGELVDVLQDKLLTERTFVLC